MTTKTKKDLVQEIAQEHNMHPNDVRCVVQSFLDKMMETLSEGQRLEFRHFGVFEVVNRKAKVGRNPKKADVAIMIPPRKAVKFTPGKRMKEMIQTLSETEATTGTTTTGTTSDTSTTSSYTTTTTA